LTLFHWCCPMKKLFILWPSNLFGI
jgi:hypothetical protein